jgi:anti-sigma28 factor (negative regulator of flagellin synthesis)
MTRVKQDKDGRNWERNKRVEVDIKKVNKYKKEIRNGYYAINQSINI